MWTLFNADFRTYRGPVLEVPHRAGANYRDAWNQTDLTPQLHGDQAVLSTTLGPREVGCIVQTRNDFGK